MTPAKKKLYIEVLDEEEKDVLRRYWAERKREQRARQKFFEKLKNR